MVLERAHRRGDDGHVGNVARVAALDVPELLEADIGSEAGLGDVVVGELERDLVGHDRGLSDRDVGEGAGVHEAGLPLDGLEQVGVDGIAHPRGHRARHFEVFGGDRIALLVVGDHDLAHAPPEVRHVAEDRKDRHHLGGHRNVEARRHHETVLLAPDTDDDVAQGLGAEVDHPAHLHPVGIDVESPQVSLRQSRVAVVELVLHARGERDHAEVVGIDERVDVSGEAERELGERDALREPASRRRALDVEGGPARRLADAGGDPAAALADALQQSHRGRRLAFSERRGVDGGDLDELAVRASFEATQHARVVHFRNVPAVGNQLVAGDAELFRELLGGLHSGLGRLRDLPIGVLSGV